MRYTILVLAVALATGTTHARADQIVTYNMTGTITSTQAFFGYNGLGKLRNPTPLPFAVGDHISWTLQYDCSTPGSINTVFPGDTQGNYIVSAPLITNIVDQTTGLHFLRPITGTTSPGYSSLRLENPPPNGVFRGGEIWSNDQSSDASNGVNDSLRLSTPTPLPTLNLAQFQLTKLQVVMNNVNYSHLSYEYESNMDGSSYQFEASVDSIAGVTAAAPEPGSLTLFFLGAAGLAAGGICRRLRRVGETTAASMLC